MERLGQGYLWFGVPIALLILSRDARLRRDAATWLLAMVTDLLTVAAIKVGHGAPCACRHAFS